MRGKAVKSLSRFHTADCDRGFVYVDAEGVARISQLPPNVRYGDTGWVTKKIELCEEVTNVSYFAPKKLYCTANVEKVMFKLPDDDYHHEWAKEDTSFLPMVDQAVIKLYYPQDWSVIDVYHLDPAEVVLTMKIIELEVSEHTRVRKPLLCIGTAIMHGEDLATKGNVYIFEVNTVVPEPGRPETGSKFKLIVKEEVRGAVTALTEIGDEGFLLHAQGQKCMVRGLKEDNTLLPVAFLDMQTYVTVAKALKGTGMTIMGDVVKGLWFTGYTVSCIVLRSEAFPNELHSKNLIASRCSASRGKRLRLLMPTFCLLTSISTLLLLMEKRIFRCWNMTMSVSSIHLTRSIQLLNHEQTQFHWVVNA